MKLYLAAVLCLAMLVSVAWAAPSKGNIEVVVVEVKEVLAVIIVELFSVVATKEAVAE